MMYTHPFEPVVDSGCHTLILGSFPSVKSRENGFYYGHPQNRFWRVLAGVFGEETPKDIPGKTQWLLRHGIALWDVAAACDITGSSDASIRSVAPVDIRLITDAAPIRRVICNGRLALRLYREHLECSTGLPAQLAPSTSPANAAWSLPRLTAAWHCLLTREHDGDAPAQNRILETDRLVLRPLTVADAEAEFAWLSDPEVNRFMPYNLYTSVDEARDWLRTVEACKDECHFGFVRKEDGLLIGAGSIGPKDGRPYAIADAWEFGYNLRRDAWNHGYATEATRAMIDFARREFGVRIFYANHAIANPASGRVMEKLGCTFDHFSEYSTFDGTETFPAKVWVLHLDR